MKSPSTSTPVAASPRAGPVLSAWREGFTLLEILIVIAIVSAVAVLGLFISMDVYRGFIHRSERDTIVSLLERARSHAMANIGEAPWGFCAVSGSYVIFSGTTYSASTVETSIATSSASVVTGVPVCGPDPSGAIIFAQLSGKPVAAVTPITVQQTGGTATIIINDQGTITW